MAKENKNVKNEEVDTDELEVVQLTDDDGKQSDYYFLGTMDYKGKEYAFFEPVQEPADEEEGEIVIFEINGQEGDENVALLPIEDEDYLQEIYDAYCAEYYKEFPEESES